MRRGDDRSRSQAFTPPLSVELQYKAMKRDGVQHLGDGMTLDISSGGVLFHVNDVFETKDILPDGGMIELAIKWPLLLDEVCPLKLVVRGCIVRRDDTRLAVKTEQHEFRTAGRLVKILVGPLSAHRRIPQGL
jgi:hypothetical protein